MTFAWLLLLLHSGAAVPDAAGGAASVSLWALADDRWQSQVPILRSHVQKVNVDFVMVGCGLAYQLGSPHMVEATVDHRNGQVKYCRGAVRDVRSLGLTPWLWLHGGSFNASMDAFRAMATDSMDLLVSATAEACSLYGFGGINIDWELGPADRRPADRELMLRFMRRARAPLQRRGCSLSLFTGEGVHQLNRVQADYVPYLTEVQSGDLYRGTDINDWRGKLRSALDVVPQHLLRPGFCCNGCKQAWSATNASVVERLAVLGAEAPNVTKVAIWVLGPHGTGGEECPTPFYWRELARFAPRPASAALASAPGAAVISI
ncbi:unnamed protein product [Prorocentrum cordatum]|uniref:GH18 domain-containing protein n=1 Tax=Prorocentrum cordatum TaxID=2364126 RepID=A0ABN9UWM1_9DINO|nr:unnamed protein product [Polarella glacialis]